MVEVLKNEDAAVKLAALVDRLVEACAVWTALHETGAHIADTRWKWSEGQIIQMTHQIHALRVVMRAEGKGRAE